jgi:hypothetical protein
MPRSRKAKPPFKKKQKTKEKANGKKPFFLNY